PQVPGLDPLTRTPHHPPPDSVSPVSPKRFIGGARRRRRERQRWVASGADGDSQADRELHSTPSLISSPEAPLHSGVGRSGAHGAAAAR
ncbi:unnamed protein product, partial [Urochloa humidicola]